MILEFIGYGLLGALIGIAVAHIMIKGFKIYNHWKIQLGIFIVINLIYFLFLI
jgi:hypothetical protein